jgi:hypothetical protein
MCSAPLQAEMLEVESQNLLAEASQEKMKVDRHLQKKATIEQVGLCLLCLLCTAVPAVPAVHNRSGVCAVPAATCSDRCA